MQRAALARLAVVVLAATGCSRDLELPGASAFTVSASPATVAPRQASTLTARGGSGAPSTWAFAFDTGGKLSGDDASIVANGDGTATYTAGRNGSTQDTVTVTDGSGRTLRAILTVGARLAITPQVSATAPGGALAFTASGGKSPYLFAVQGGTGAAVVPDPLDGTRATYTAGSAGDAVETVTVTDATHDAAASATATIQVGTRLTLYRPTTGPVAPNEQVTLVAFGGRSPYAYGPACAAAPPQPAGCFASPAQPVFSVGSAWSVGLVVRASVLDANGQTAYVDLAVGPPLVGELASPLVRPGVLTRVIASGGKPPYAFRFAKRGNHSHGQVDGISGTYLPGPSPGAQDRLEVVDATGTVAAVTGVLPVGPLEITTGTNAERCVAGDFDGDGSEDLAFLFGGMSLLEVNQIASATPLYRSYYVGSGFRFPAAFPADHDANGRSELMFLGSRSGGPTRFDGISNVLMPFWALRPDMTGLFANPDGLGTTAPDGGNGTRLHDTGSAVTSYLLDCSSCSPGLCAVNWTQGLSLPSATGCSAAIDNRAALGWPVALVGADLTGDGLGDLVWLGGSTSTVYANTYNTDGSLFLRPRGATTFTDAGSLALPMTLKTVPTPTFYEGLGNGEQSRFQRIPPIPGATAEAVAVRLNETATGRGWVAIASGNPLAWRGGGAFDPYGGTGMGAYGLVPFTPEPGGTPLLAVVTGNDGDVRIVDPSVQGTSPKGIDVGFPASFGCAVDADGDGFPDLAVGGDRSGVARLLWGDGRGGFGTRARLGGATLYAAGGDVDGDGLVDVVTSDGQTLSVLFGDAGQLGWGDRPVSLLSVASVAVAPFVDYAGLLPASTDSILFQTITGDYYVVHASGTGGFLDPAPITVTQKAVPVAHSWLLPGDLGGAAYGPDLLAPEDDNYGHSWVHLLIRSADTSLTEYATPYVGRYSASSIVKTHQCAYAPVGSGSGATAKYGVASLCAYESTAGQPAANWRVRGFPLAGTIESNAWADAGFGGSNPGVAGTETSMAPIGTFGGKAWFVVATDRLWVVSVDPGADASNPAVWTVGAPVQITPPPLRSEPFFSRIVDLDGNGVPDVVVGGRGSTVVLKNTGTATAPVFAPWDVVPAGGFPLAAGKLAQGALPSVVLAGQAGLQILPGQADAAHPLK